MHLSKLTLAEQLEHQMANRGLPRDADDLEFVEHRIVSQYAPDITNPNITHPFIEEDYDEYTWTPYEQDLSSYPEIFKMYGENFEKYQKVKARFDNEKPGEQPAEAPSTPRKPKDQSPWEKKYDDYMPKYTGESFN